MKEFIARANIFFFLVCFWTCQSQQKQENGSAVIAIKVDSMQQLRQDSVARAALNQKAIARMDSLAELAKAKPIWGKRMKVVGDFDGDGAQDTLYERYLSQLTGKETNKDYDFEGLGEGEDYLFYWQDWIAEKKVLLKLVCQKPSIKPFMVDKGGLQNGFLYLKNVGDLNQDSTDELAFILNTIDFTNSNTGYLATYRNGKWKVIADWAVTEIDFQFDPLKGKKPDPKYVFKKTDGSVYLKEFDGNKLGNINWKRLKTNW